MATASLTGLRGMHTLFDLPLGPILHTASPHYYRHAPAGMTERQFSRHLAPNEIDELVAKFKAGVESIEKEIL